MLPKNGEVRTSLHVDFTANQVKHRKLNLSVSDKGCSLFGFALGCLDALQWWVLDSHAFADRGQMRSAIESRDHMQADISSLWTALTQDIQSMCAFITKCLDILHPGLGFM